MRPTGDFGQNRLTGSLRSSFSDGLEPVFAAWKAEADDGQECFDQRLMK